jgi:hypothetical protein
MGERARFLDKHKTTDAGACAASTAAGNGDKIDDGLASDFLNAFKGMAAANLKKSEEAFLQFLDSSGIKNTIESLTLRMGRQTSFSRFMKRN